MISTQGKMSEVTGCFKVSSTNTVLFLKQDKSQSWETGDGDKHIYFHKPLTTSTNLKPISSWYFSSWHTILIQCFINKEKILLPSPWPLVSFPCPLLVGWVPQLCRLEGDPQCRPAWICCLHSQLRSYDLLSVVLAPCYKVNHLWPPLLHQAKMCSLELILGCGIKCHRTYSRHWWRPEVRRASEPVWTCVVKCVLPSVAREEFCLVVRAQAGSHDSQSLFLLFSDSLYDLWQSLYLSGSHWTPFHVVLQVFLRFQTSVLCKVFKPSGESLWKEKLLLELREIIQVGLGKYSC